MVGRARGDGDAHSFDPDEQDRFHCPEPMNESQAWEKFEEAMRDVESFDEAMAWLNKNPEIREGLTVFEMMRNFNRDIRNANKYNRN